MRRNLARTDMNLDVRYQQLDRPDDAARYDRQAVTALDQVVHDDHAVAEFRRNLAQAHLNFGSLQALQRQFDDAECSLIQARDLREELLRDDPKDVAAETDLCVTLNGLSTLYQELHQPADALPCFERAVALTRKRQSKHSADTNLHTILAVNLEGVGSC
jgi:tetratricopeptide (TPR) repeat protein